MLTDVFVDKRDAPVSIECVCSVLSEICVPLAGRSIIRLQTGHGANPSTDEMMIEFELCIGLVFKPLRHNLQNVMASNRGNTQLFPIWKAVLSVIEELRGASTASSEDDEVLPDSLRRTMQDLAAEHLQNAIKVLMSVGVIVSDPERSPKTPNDLSSLTWDSVGRMGFGKETIDSWKTSGAEPEEAEG